MVVLTEKARDEGFLLSEANGYRSRAEITLESGYVYAAGTVVIEVAGTYTAATKAAVDAVDAGPVAIVARNTDASAADTVAAGIVADAEVRDLDLIVGAATTLTDVTAALKAQGIVVRSAI